MIKVTLEDQPEAAQDIHRKGLRRHTHPRPCEQGQPRDAQPVHRIGLKSHGHSTLGGRKVWFDADVNRLNYDEHGRLLGEFNEDDAILVVLDNGDFPHLVVPDANNHYEGQHRDYERWDPDKIWTAALFDADNRGRPLHKAFPHGSDETLPELHRRERKAGSSCSPMWRIPRLEVTFKPITTPDGQATQRRWRSMPREFITVEGFKAKENASAHGMWEEVTELEPTLPQTKRNRTTMTTTTANPKTSTPMPGRSQQQVIDEMTGQLNLFDNDSQ